MENKNEWRKIKLGEIGEIVSGGTPKTSIKKYWNGNISWLTPKDFSNKNCKYWSKGERNITKEGLENSSAKLLPRGTVLFTSRAPIGYIGISKTDLCTNQGFKNIIVNEENSNEFIYYLLKFITPQIINIAGGSTFKEISATVLRDFEVYIPKSKKYQEKIAKILSDIDEKIELNNKINDNLENLLKIIHNKFINSITGENNIISKIIDITDGTHNSPKAQDTGYPLVTSKHLLAYGVNFESINLISKEDYIEINKRSKVDTGDILISMIGTVGLISYVINSPINFAIKNVALFKTSKNPLYKFFILGYLKSPAGINYIKKNLAGSTQKYISLSELRKMPIITPTKIQLKEYNRQISPIVTQISFLVKENEKLTNLKNYLLSKLMNGEIDVEKIEL